MKVTSLDAGAYSRAEGESGVENAPDDAEKMDGEEEAADVTGKPEEKPQPMESYFSAGDIGHSQMSLVSRGWGSPVSRLLWLN